MNCRNVSVGVEDVTAQKIIRIDVVNPKRLQQSLAHATY